MALYAIDTEMINTENGFNLARVAIVNENGATVLDYYVRPTDDDVDYRNYSHIHDITREGLEDGLDFNTVKRTVQRVLKGSTLIGHSLKYHLEALELSHPKANQRDLATYEPFKQMNNGQPASLQFLAEQLLERFIQQGFQDSVENAKASMDVYKKVASQWR